MFKRLWNFLFDFSSAEKNQEEVEIILRTALRESTTDLGFEEKLKEVVAAFDNNDGEYRRLLMIEFINHNSRTEDMGWGIRTRAEHVLEDLPRIYGQKKVK
jgi:hypothetical protein